MSPQVSRRVLNFWQSLWRYQRNVVRSWEWPVSAVLAIAGAYLLPDKDTSKVAVAVASGELGVVSALFGLVLAGLAILVVFLNRAYVTVLMETGGVEEDFFFFWFTATLAVVSIVWNVGLTELADYLNWLWVRIAFGVGTGFFLWTLFATLNLVALVNGHGANRAIQLMQKGGDVDDA